MNFEVNLFFRLYETHITPLGIPNPNSLEGERWGGLGGVIMGKKKFALKCSTGKIKCFKTMLLLLSFFFNGNPGHRGPPQPA